MIGNEKKYSVSAKGVDEAFGIAINTYPAVVHSVNDPLNLRRIKVVCKSLLISENPSPYCIYKGTYTGEGYGMYLPLPKVGDNVVVRTATGSKTITRNNPLIWDYGIIAQDEIPSEATDTAFTTILPDGSKLILEDGDDPLFKVLQKSGHSIEIDDSKTLISRQGGTSITIENDKVTIQDSSGNKIEMSSSGIVIESSQGAKMELDSLAGIGNAFGGIKSLFSGFFTAFAAEAGGLLPNSAAQALQINTKLPTIFK